MSAPAHLTDMLTDAFRFESAPSLHPYRLLFAQTLKMSCLQVGTLQYLSPEVLQKRPAGYASDVYAWAVTINEVATGVFPFSDCTKDNPKVHTVLDFGYGRFDTLLS